MEKDIRAFANLVKRFSNKYGNKNTSNLLWYTCWTIGKQYDEEEQHECILEDTRKWIYWEADYMW